MNFWKRVWRGAVITLSILIFFVLASNLWVVFSTRSKVLIDQQQLQERGVALVLGTSHRMISGVPNPFFENRIATAADLYRNGKVLHFILSGDNRTRYYNEPMEMKKALMKLGVPDSAITLDHAGLRTLDSIVRCKEIFGQSNIIIITQPFHSYRALFISDYYHIDAVALVAKEPSQEIAAQVYLREYLARTKAVLDLYILGTGPRHLGEKEPLSL
jgi:SanA protein